MAARLKTDLLIGNFSKVANRSILGKLLCDPLNYTDWLSFLPEEKTI